MGAAATVNEDCRRRFEAAWRAGRAGPLEEFLPPAADPAYRATLEELVKIELEFLWKARGRGGAPPPRVEDYLARFPALGEPAVVRALLAEEFRARCGGGGAPDAAEYLRRFPGVLETAADLDVTLPGAGPARPDDAPAVAGYEVLGVLGRGGMGVVYKARQVALDRVVALKVLPSGAAGAEELDRFRTEAQALARLQHPNVVQVHEVGAAGGRPYLALEYVAGGTLAQRLAGDPQPARDAAALLEALARAVAAVHQCGVLHRDLKPANVLLQSGDGRLQNDGPAPSPEEGVSSGQSTICNRPSPRSRTSAWPGAKAATAGTRARSRSWARRATWRPSRPPAGRRSWARRRTCTRWGRSSTSA